MRSEALEWTITTWNIQGSARPDLDDLATAIAIEAPDVVVLQEIREQQAAALAAKLKMRYTWALKHYPYTPLLRRKAEGLAIMSAHALDAAGHSEISNGKSKWSYRRRIAQWCLVGRADTSAYRIYNVHLVGRADANAERRAQAVAVSDIINDHGDAPPAVVAGDLNDSTDASIVYALPGIEFFTPEPTNPSNKPTQILDHVLLPPAAFGVACTVPAGGPEWARRSDHLPVTVRFSLDWVQGDLI